MARPKSPENKTTAEVLQDNLAIARARRLAAHQAKKPSLTDTQAREEFRKFWTAAKKEYGRPKEIEEALYIYLKHIGYNTPDKFAAGLKLFGLKKLGEK